MDRHYYRCPRCLSTMVVEDPVENAHCGACGARLEHLGPVTDAGAYLTVRERPACDGRCINATGPSCDCQCGGRNHGTGRMVQVIREGGRAVLVPADGAAAARADEYRAARRRVVQALRRVYGADYERYHAGLRVGSGAWYGIRAVERQLDNIARLRSHSTRIRRLMELAERLEAERTA